MSTLRPGVYGGDRLLVRGLRHCKFGGVFPRPELPLPRGNLATLGHTGEALAVIQRYRERHPEDSVAADLERAIRADAAR